ncbi:MAG: EAL domain-containing protein [Lachnospiraceae bacterium]|nr:EAL domain-containing protein [Lachnospiraceae bacterium]
MEKKIGIKSFVRRVEGLTIVRAVRNALIHITPIVLIGAFALIFKTLPIIAYQNFINTFQDGILVQLFDTSYMGTMGILSVYMTYAVSRSYMKIKGKSQTQEGGAIISSIVSFFIVTGIYLPDFGIEHMGVKSMFLAIVTALGASAMYFKLTNFMSARKTTPFLIGANRAFNKMLSTIFPIMAVVSFFSVANIIIITVFKVDSCRSLMINFFNGLFSSGEVGFFKGYMFVIVTSLLWFCGIHGSDTLEGVMQTYFVPGLAENQAAVAAGTAPSTILTKEFFDCFVFIGGCGATICLLISIFIFSRSRVRRGIGLAAAFPMVFNINELMVFGLPIVFNITMLVPFLLTPLVLYTISYFAIASGIVPHITTEVVWTTPIFMGGYHATGTAAGAILQLVNVIVGILIYAPFVRYMDKTALESAKDNYESFIKFFKENEQSMSKITLTELENVYGDFAKDLCNDMKYGLRRQVVLAYQPQYHYDGHCIGAEALLRWEHPVLGVIYPPLVIKLAEEGGFLAELEEKIVEQAISDRPEVLARFGENIKISINVTATTVVTPRYIQFCKSVNDKTPFADMNICLEVTEQSEIFFTEDTIKALRELREMGLLLAIDDFSMGQTSIQYLQDSLFDIIKLDGSLVKGLLTRKNARDIILSIVNLANSLQLTVLAEYVDSEEKRSMLHDIGCDNYQGYLYSPAVFLDDK